MAMERDDVLRVAELARLELEGAEVDRIARELSAVLEFVAAIQRLDLAHAEPTVFAPADAAARDDGVDEERRLTPEQATAAAPEAEDGYFLVPPIVENIPS
jgi:aspartyl-tRNA(Asn)/glutamyl-tRNA(Gln) amidotransferase subunit C